MNPYIKHILIFLAYAFFQIFLLNELIVAQVATSFVFLLFLLMLPLNIPSWALYLIAFSTGLVIDFFSYTDANGIHAFSCLLMMGAREFWIGFITASSYRTVGEVSFENQNLLWYAIYLLPLIFVHHFAYFFLEAFGMQNFLITLLKIFTSTIYTFVLCFLLCTVFYKK
ncbi:hypothetical protein N9933_01220 [bacterium]|nr:hypothetical protein [bacterium]